MTIQTKKIFPETPIAEIQKIFEAQRIAFTANKYPDISSRIELLKRLKGEILQDQEALTNALSADFGHRSHDETRIYEILTVVKSVNSSIKNIKQWSKESRRKVDVIFQPASNKVIYQPLGIIGVMVPWNYPLFLSLSPLISAITAGNRVMVKLSEFTPQFNQCLTEVLSRVFQQDQVAVVTGETEVSTAFSSLNFDHLFFTGSTNVGKLVMAAAAKNLTPVTLELGGKSPVIITDNVDMELAAERICFGKSLNAGQTCVAPDYVLCPEHRKDEFIDAFSKAFTRMYPQVKDNPDYSNIINDSQYQRLQALLDDAIENGAKLTYLNPGDETFDNTRKMPPVIIENCQSNTLVLTEEIFGPILPLVTYKKLEQAIEYINERPRPLALYLFSFKKSEQELISYQSHSGGVCINNTIVHLAQGDLPFGGIGDSGMGHYHGFEGFQTFSKAKSIHKVGKLASGKILLPPYNKVIHRLFYKLFIR
jgi:coniferyl-aldehyde dehydrogenase|tara:strand:+ start:823 stop:2262 length:1440 start_codon:yes stop_codon:yes gene_type:complete